MLLYWDQVCSIVPSQFIDRPELLGPYMRSLVEQELVLQVIPGVHIHEIPKFEGTFQGYLEGLGQEAARRQARFARGSTFKVHIEKMGNIGQALVQRRLAREAEYPWYEVERETAQDFMSYLAAALGQLPSVNSSPITDQTTRLGRFARAGVSEDCVVQQLQSLRICVLESVLPVVGHPIPPRAIREFRDRHRDLLRQFRRRVETELVQAADVADGPRRQYLLEIFLEEARGRIEQIQAAMHGAGWQTVRASLSVLATVPGAPQVFGLVAALWDALSRGQHQTPSQDFAYAAYARAEL
jgi:hypothetical protein